MFERKALYIATRLSLKCKRKKWANAPCMHFSWFSFHLVVWIYQFVWVRPCGSGTSFMQTLWTKTHFACRRSALSWLARNKILSAQSLFLFSLLSFAVLFTNLSHNCHFFVKFLVSSQGPEIESQVRTFFLLFCRWWVTFFNNCHSFNSIDQHSF